MTRKKRNPRKRLSLSGEFPQGLLLFFLSKTKISKIIQHSSFNEKLARRILIKFMWTNYLTDQVKTCYGQKTKIFDDLYANFLSDLQLFTLPLYFSPAVTLSYSLSTTCQFSPFCFGNFLECNISLCKNKTLVSKRSALCCSGILCTVKIRRFVFVILF